MTSNEKMTNLSALEALAEQIAGEIPTNISKLTNDAGYQTETQVAAAIAAADHLKRKKVASVDAIDLEAADAAQYIYMVPKADAGDADKYDEYIVIDGAIEAVGDWTVDLSDYQQKQEGAGLYPDTDKTKLASVAEGATKAEASETPGCVKINGTDVQVVEIATDAEIDAMLAEVFGT